MIYASAIERKLGKNDNFSRLKSLLEAFGLLKTSPMIDANFIMHAVSHDKKNRNGFPQFVLSEDIGLATINNVVPDKSIRSCLLNYQQ